MNWYNEPDPYAAQWLRNLIAASHLAPGVVDTRPIQEVEARELSGYAQCHFFCGIGVWPFALRQAGWPDDTPIWTGSCPCQPFSVAGQQKGFSDDRHLWLYWFKLIAERRPATIVGEQVASALEWLDLVSGDLENEGYAFGAADLCAAGFGGAHIRQRNYFVGLADDDEGLEGWERVCKRRNQRTVGASSLVDGLEHADLSGEYERAPSGQQSLRVVGDERNENPAIRNSRQAQSLDDADWLLCRNPAGEPSWRPVESGTFPLAHGVASRMGKLRAYGNALDAETAIAFCEAVKEIVFGIRPVNEYDL